MGKKWPFVIPEDTPLARKRFAEFFRKLLEAGTGRKTERGQIKGWSPTDFGEKISKSSQTIGTWCNAKAIPRSDNFDLVLKSFFDDYLVDPRRIQLVKLWEEAHGEKINTATELNRKERITALDPHELDTEAHPLTNITQKLPTAFGLFPAFDPSADGGSLRSNNSYPIHGMPPPLASFVVRQVIFEQLCGCLFEIEKPTERGRPSNQQCVVGRAVLIGMPGVGKTTIAAEFAHRFRDRYDEVWWCSAETRVALFTSLAGFARRLGEDIREQTKLEEVARNGLRRLAEKNGTYLLIYDNVTNPDIIADLFPVAGAQVLITSRFPDWRNWAQEIDVDILSPSEAIELLESRAGRQDAAGAKILAEALGWLPLALDHSAAFCRRPMQTSFADYAAKAVSLIKEAPPRGAPYQRSINATFALAIEAAAEACPAAEMLMAFIVCCSPERIPKTLLEGAFDEQIDLADALLALSDLSLIRSDPFEDGTKAITVHRLTRAVTRSRSTKISTANYRLMGTLLKIYPRLDPSFSFCRELKSSLQLCEQLTPHLLERFSTPATGWGYREVAELKLRAGLYLHDRGIHGQARHFYEDAVKLREQAQNVDWQEVAYGLRCLGGLLWEQGDLAAARQIYQRVLGIMDNAIGPTHRCIIIDLDNLGKLLLDQNDFRTASPIFQRLLALQEKYMGHENPLLVVHIDDLALVLQKLGDLDAARKLLERALVISAENPATRERLNPEACLSNLAQLLREMGDLSAARGLFERALAVSEKQFGVDSPRTAKCLNNLANILRDQRDLTGAQLLENRANIIMADFPRQNTKSPYAPQPLYGNELTWICPNNSSSVI